MGMMFPTETKSIIESLLFVSREPLTLKSLSQILEMPAAEIKMLVDELTAEYNLGSHGINISIVASGYQMHTRPEFAPYIERLYKPQNSYGLSRAALETLAIVAYKQPITRAEIEAIRGVKVDSSIGTLVEKNLVKEVGRKEGPGRPMLFGTSDSFLKYFGLTDLSELPDPDQFAVQHGFSDQMEIHPSQDELTQNEIMHDEIAADIDTDIERDTGSKPITGLNPEVTAPEEEVKENLEEE